MRRITRPRGMKEPKPKLPPGARIVKSPRGKLYVAIPLKSKKSK